MLASFLETRPEIYFVILFVVAVLLASRTLWGAVARVFRALGTIILNLARTVGLASKRGAELGSGAIRNAGGNAVLVPLQWAFTDSKIDEALLPFAAENEPNLVRKGALFRLIEVKGNVVPHTSAVTDADIDKLYDDSADLFEPDIDYFVDRHRYYEEIEGEQIIRMIGRSDSSILYYLNEARKTANGNIRNFMTWSWFVMSAFLALAILTLNDRDVALYSYFIQDGGTLALMQFVGPLAWVILSVGALWVINLTYAARQPLLMKSLQGYVVAYISRLTEQFRVINARLNSIFNNFDDEESARAAAAKSMVAFEYIAFRQLFVQMFARNMLFQIRRNFALYLVYVAAIFALLNAFIASVIGGGFEPAFFGDWVNVAVMVWLIVLGGVLLDFIFQQLNRLEDPLNEEIVPASWNGFKVRRYRSAVGDLAGLYNREIVFQRNRFRSSTGR
jgi:hypothetical protein